MDKIIIDGYEFLRVQAEKATMIFSTAKNNLNFNIHCDEGKNNILRLKQWFGLDDISYLYQKHSDNVYIQDGNIYEGDGIITNKKNIGIGVFTADCVPVLLYDKVENVVAAVHSGWKGTLSCITIKALEKMQKEYGCSFKNINAYIGPHNRMCCYEIGEDVADKFNKSALYSGIEIIKNNKLNLERCIVRQLEYLGVSSKNINTMNLCTYCNEEIQLFSYRKSKENYGRMFSFIFIK
ncbi:peptidoglycan editing factor PgeF [Clostridium sp. SYSU_GA19001]|uniref:peptidoglycan editing factor PgeF n=1 Tax=Clostridium caldaquaticum TaxID=2940653 RepID=UPI0020771F9F|nr:peptidoglycan editing factor PgeF [Clostridium caldaquaticum]MCM8710482.1 peptidoglycan editing factor PgeF [Clostridium caldaquaticum]